MITACFIEHDHVEGCRGRSLLIKTAHVEARRIRAAMENLVNRPRIAVEGKHDRFIFREVLNEGSFTHAVWMNLWWVERHEVYHVDHAHFEFWQMLAQPPGCSNRFLGHDVASTSQHHVWLHF